MKHKIKIKKVRPDEKDETLRGRESPYVGMWRGTCTCQQRRWHFWFFGATLGYALEHLRRDGNY